MIVLLGRILLGGLFVMAGIGKIGTIDGFTQMVESSGFPGILAWPVVLFEILAGLAVITGFYTRYAALALAAFCLFTAFVFHYAPGDQMQMAMMTKNLAITGGLLILYAHGAGLLSVDARRGGIS